jgi:hypothetical protein
MKILGLPRTLVIGLGVFVLAFVLSAAWLLGTAWYRVPHYEVLSTIELEAPTMTPDGYGAVIDTHARPFVYEIEAESPRGTGAVLIYGAEHTKNPDDPQVAAIATRWETFAPTTALVESDLGMMFPAFMDPVETFGEVGAVHALARDAGIPTYTWEPPDDVLVASLKGQGFTAREVALRVMLGPYFSNLRHGRPENPESFVEEFRAERTRWAGLEDTFATVDEIDAEWRKRFPDGPDWREVSDQYGLPGFLGEMDANQARDEHFARVVIDLTRKGERVFAICGSSHAVKLEPALRATLGGVRQSRSGISP